MILYLVSRTKLPQRGGSCRKQGVLMQGLVALIYSFILMFMYWERTQGYDEHVVEFLDEFNGYSMSTESGKDWPARIGDHLDVW